MKQPLIVLSARSNEFELPRVSPVQEFESHEDLPDEPIEFGTYQWFALGGTVVAIDFRSV